MRRPAQKLTFSCLDVWLRTHLPEFVPVSPPLPPGWRAYAWIVAPDLTVYVIIGCSASEEHFVVEVGWSSSGQFPDELAGHLLPDEFGRWRPHEPVNGGLRFRLTEFVPNPPRASFDLEWDVILGTRCDQRHADGPRPNATMSSVAACIEDAFEIVRQFAFPYISHRTGIDIPCTWDRAPSLPHRRQ